MNVIHLFTEIIGMLVNTCDSKISFAINHNLLVSKLTFKNILGQKTLLPLTFQDTPGMSRYKPLTTVS